MFSVSRSKSRAVLAKNCAAKRLQTQLQRVHFSSTTSSSSEQKMRISTAAKLGSSSPSTTAEVGAPTGLAAPVLSNVTTTTASSSSSSSSSRSVKEALKFTDTFPERHLGPSEREIQFMLETLNVATMEELLQQTIPQHIRKQLTEEELNAPRTRSETEVVAQLKEMVSDIRKRKNYLGQGYYGTLVPHCILRNLFENPAWYTAYTPYQAEISQGRLESLFNFQTLVTELTGMEVANASLLDEGSACAEAVAMLLRVSNLKDKDTVFVSDTVHLQTIKTVETRAKYLKINLLVGNAEEFDFSQENLIGAVLQYPDTFGRLKDMSSIADELHKNKGHLIVAADPLNLVLAKTPAAMGADVVVGNMQRFGVPMFAGGPSAAFFATHLKYLRKMPGRIIGESLDKEKNPAYRLTLQTREQHIRYDKATSNVCTSQALLANASAMYAVYHQKAGLQKIAQRVVGLANAFRNEMALNTLGSRGGGTSPSTKVVDLSTPHFDTIPVNTLPLAAEEVAAKMADLYETNVRVLNSAQIAVSIDESHSLEDIQQLAAQLTHILGLDGTSTTNKATLPDGEQTTTANQADLIACTELPPEFQRPAGEPFLEQEIFNSIHSETEMMRYLHRLQSKDLSLVHSMITLGSCTMKLNSVSSLLPLSWHDEIANVHPYAPVDSVPGYRKMLHQLEQYLCKITAFDACSLQPASGAMGEYAGLLAIRRYHESQLGVAKSKEKNLCIIAKSAHGTNPASAAMIGMEVKWIDDSKGQLPLQELKQICAENKGKISALMITYPSTQGIFEEQIVEICDTIHEAGGLVYMDGANMNAHLGLTAPGKIGADVCHLNLHKTFSIPHGGGGPGMGPICCNSKLAPFLPGHFQFSRNSENAVSNAPFGQAGIAAIPWMFISMLGAEGLRKSAEVAILNANYLKERLQSHYKIAFSDVKPRCSHEFILEVADIKKATGVTEEDIAKRLQDYGYHAPTMSWPKPHSLMIEPTESEDLSELDRFCDALIAIREEIRKIETGEYTQTDNPLKNAPHSQQVCLANDWISDCYSRETAAFPLPYLKERGKIWPACSRVDNGFGDKNLKLTLQKTQGEEA